tara:strand:- start:947 stop:1252 length:306 start_codon:yes stop_codon:yes gene_type:complete
MKLTRSQLEKLIQEELEVLLREKSELHFSQSQSKEKATATRNQCIADIVKGKKVDPEPGTTLVQAAARICVDTAKIKGATLDRPEDEKEGDKDEDKDNKDS